MEPKQPNQTDSGFREVTARPEGHAADMPAQPLSGGVCLLTHEGLQALISALHADGRDVIGPVLRDGAIVYDRVAAVSELPAGWTDVQEPGRYRLVPRDDRALFGYAVGPHSWKRYLQPPTETLWRARRTADGFAMEGSQPAPPRHAFLAVRACELHAIAIQDRVFLGGAHPDIRYGSRRDDLFVVALNCGQAGGTCFCVSMNAGPAVREGYDIALTEVLDEGGHVFLAEPGSPRGAALLASLPARAATVPEIAAARAVVQRTVAGMGRRLETAGLKERLQAHPEHPRWTEVAERCLSCANCTMVCPTCFCFTVDETTDLALGTAERVRSWDSCFNPGFSYVHGGSVRSSGAARYRQWLTHKLAGWIDQFGTSGCVGCGRCITWCPTGIDITEEAAAIGLPAEAGHGDA
jgi:sulfhydrogenase subunit beta (sulfur reductase)